MKFAVVALAVLLQLAGIQGECTCARCPGIQLHAYAHPVYHGHHHPVYHGHHHKLVPTLPGNTFVMKACRDILPAAVAVARKLSQANLQSKYRLVSITRWGGAGVNVTYLNSLEAGVLRNCSQYFTWGGESSSCRSHMHPYNPIAHLQSPQVCCSCVN